MNSWLRTYRLEGYLVRLIAVSVALAFVEGCTAAQHQAQLGSTTERQMTVGLVQREIRKGMSQADVATALGSPNIVTNDGSGRETWIYDKIASEASVSQSSAYATLLLLGVGGASGAASTTQRTLTVIIKFDDQKRVDTFSYNSSKF
jgi:outer membrane protein assembly factor BamE (lipoprotein component of BamABCDE complex)